MGSRDDGLTAYHANIGGMHVRIRMCSRLFKLDLVMMSIVILCIMSAGLYQGIAWVEKRMG